MCDSVYKKFVHCFCNILHFTCSITSQHLEDQALFSSQIHFIISCVRENAKPPFAYLKIEFRILNSFAEFLLHLGKQYFCLVKSTES